MRELMDRGLRALILFVIAWVILGVMNMFACRQVEGGEMGSAVEAGSWKFMAPVSKLEDVEIDSIVHFGYEGRMSTRDSFVDRVKEGPGEMAEFSSYLSTIRGSSDEKETLTILIPRDCFLILADITKINDTDSRRLGPIRFWAIDGKVR